MSKGYICINLMINGSLPRATVCIQQLWPRFATSHRQRGMVHTYLFVPDSGWSAKNDDKYERTDSNTRWCFLILCVTGVSRAMLLGGARRGGGMASHCSAGRRRTNTLGL